MQFGTLKRIQDVLEYIRSGKTNELDCGRHDLFDGVYVNVSQYQTKEASFFEAHRRYIDIHFMISGEEIVEVADVNTMSVTKDYDDTSDALLGMAAGKQYVLKEGQYMVLLPQEAHMPGISRGINRQVKKAVFKVPTDK